MSALKEIDGIAARLSASTGLAEVLAAGFDAFEAIRATARACEDSQPDLLAAFMMAAGAAVEGRNALTTAPSLPPPSKGAGGGARQAAAASAAEVGEVADALAALGDLLVRHMSGAAAKAADADDQAACADAADAAHHIRQLLAGPPQ